MNLARKRIRRRVNKQTAIDFAVYLLVRTLFAVIQTLSVQRMQPVCNGLAYLVSDVLQIRRRIIDTNLRIASPNASDQQINETRRQMWAHLVMMACEIAWSRRRLHLSNWRQMLDFPTSGIFLRPFLEGRPMVLVSGHYGNFEIGGYATGLFGIPTMTVARPLDNRFLHRYITQFRGMHGQMLVDKEGSADIIQQHLESNGTLSLVADQFAGARGCWVNFFGKPTSCHKALALFTLANDAPMAVFYSRRTTGPMQFEIGCNGVADPREAGPELGGVTELTCWYNERLEKAIALSPEQYWWMHRRWRDVPEKIQRRMDRMAAKQAA
ncbi:Lipid A biosynthesis lauroyl acyltransferase [Rosistilla oblonga]|uniref:Lipid A biosynthesis lauroyl acyltransferase n=1 Tax=Rosistilla oblonga TaxID=2527990 RepID=A0A518IVN6_9BACT|nr:Lipid A biosynthesis lauroyl acyltransferase [Rosistilla oblonga]